MRKLARMALLASILVSMTSLPVSAQSEADFVAAFSGKWQSLDPAISSGSACRLTLATARNGKTYQLSAEGCGGVLSTAAGWGIFDEQLGLADASGTVLARLGGNQTRMSGQTASGATIIFERAASDTVAISTGPIADSECVYFGYTASCASRQDREMPVVSGSQDMGHVAVLVRLNARAEARPDAPVQATIPAGTCVVVDQCTKATDGNWCRAKISNFTGWIRQETVRQGRWPVLAYAPGCR